MPKTKILVVDDEKDIVELVKYHLEKSGYKVLSTNSGGDALDIATKQKPDLIVLDVMMPGLDGFEICRILKRNDITASIPVIMLTAKTAENDIVTGLKTGADDYMTKPFSPKVLLARVESVLRRADKALKNPDTEKLVLGEIAVDLSAREVLVSSKPIILTKNEFNILVFLMKNPGKALSREQIINGAWNYETAIVDRVVDVHVRHLREKLGKNGDYIETVHGVGYKFFPREN